MFTLTPGISGAADPDLLSGRDAAIPSPVPGNGHSVAPLISPDGRYVLFSSAANTLATNDNGYVGLDSFLHDCTSGTTVLTSVNAEGTGGGNADSFGLQISMNGRNVLMESEASSLVPNDTNDAMDIFVWDVHLGANTLVSVAVGGGAANGPSSDATMTPDGRWVAFVSEATNLVPGDTNGLPDLFLRDMVLGITTSVTAGATGSNAVVSSPAITPLGRFLAFVSTAKGLVNGVPASNREEVYLYDSVLNGLTWVSSNAAASAQSALGLLNAPSHHPVLSDDGRYVAYKTGWTNGVTPAPFGEEATLVFLYDSILETTSLLTTNGFPAWFNDADVYGPVMTPNGRFVAFVEREGSNTNTAASVRLWDRLTGTNAVVSLDQNGAWPTNTSSHTPGISQDGRYITFVSDATNMVGNAVSNGFHVYHRDLLLSSNLLVDVDVNGVGSGDQFGVVPSTSGDGSKVVYAGMDGALINEDSNRWLDVFLWDATVGTNRLISARAPQAVSTSGNAPSSIGRLSLSDSGAAAFATQASDLVTNDFNLDGDVFVRDLVGGSNRLVSVGLDGNAGAGGGSFDPVLSKDGRYVAFLSWATNLNTGDKDSGSDVYRRDLLTSTTMLVSANAIGSSLSTLDCASPVMSDDGRYVAYVGHTSSSSSSRSVLWRDLATNTVRVVSTSPHFTRPLSLSADGQRLAYFDSSGRLYTWDARTNANIYSNTGSGLESAGISPNGNRLLFIRSGNLYVRTLPGVSDQLTHPSNVPIIGSEQWSGDGRYVAFATKTSLVAADVNNATDVYLLDLQTATLTLLSVNDSATASAAGDSDWPVFSRDGRFVVFRSMAADLTPGMITPPSLVLFDRVTGSNSVVATGTPGTGWTSGLAHPALSSNGTWLAFHSWDAGVVIGDFNRTGDAFISGVDAPPLVDTDGDGIPDWWTMQYFGHPTGEAGDLSLADDDADFDGLTNLEELIAGTIPVDPNSRLAIQISPSPTPGLYVLTWDAQAGRSYRVQFIPNANASVWQTLPGGISVIGNQGRVEIQNAGSERFYRVEGNN